MNPILCPPGLEPIFQWVEAQRIERIKSGEREESANLWARRRFYMIAREQWDPTWRRINEMRGKFNSMLFKPHRKTCGGWTGENRITKTCDKLCGCGWQHLRDHISGQFQEGMTWANHGKRRKDWVIDHVKPICLFDWWTNEGLAEAFHWTNVQPLWYWQHREKCASDNAAARNRRVTDPEYRKRMTYQYPPPLEGTNEQIMAALAAQLQPV